MKNQIELKSVAYHEAGHIAAAIELGIGICRRGVTIIPNPNENYFGGAHIHKGFSGNPEYETTGRMRLKVENRVLVLLAGMHAEMSFIPSSITEGEGEDLRTAWGLLEYFCGSNEEVQAYLDWLNIRAKQLVASEASQVRIEALAQALLEKRKLSAAEVKTIAKEAIERMLDGWRAIVPFVAFTTATAAPTVTK